MPAWAAQFSLTLDELRHPAFDAAGVTVTLDTEQRGAADIHIVRLRVADIEYRELRLHCSGFFFDGRRLDCPQGQLRRDDERGRERPPLPFSLAYRAADGFFELAVRDADIVVLSPLVKRLRGWQPAGRIDFKISVLQDQARLGLTLRELSFASKDGEVVGKGLALTLDAQAQRRAGGWDWQAQLDWPHGELWRKPWRRLAGVGATAHGRYDARVVEVDQARLELSGIGALTASLRWDRERGETTAWGFVSEPLDLATAMREGVQPWLTELGLPAWRTAGKARFSAEAQDGRLQRFYAGLEGAQLADGTGYIELHDVNAQIPWEAGQDSSAELRVASGRLGDLPLGGFYLPVAISGQSLRVRNLVAPLLDGRFAIEDLHVSRGPGAGSDGSGGSGGSGGWQGVFSGSIDGVSMPKLSRALGMPAMAGQMTAHIPRVAYANGVLSLDGALAIEVFDGGLIVHRLRISDPFGARRRFIADVTARGLDLGMLTQTFSFGSIEGRFDAELHDLEMAGWKPLRFDARLASSPGEYPRRVSIGALRDIAALGTAGSAAGQADAPLRQLPERAGSGFGYAQITVAAALRDGVLLLDGIGRDGTAGEGAGVVLMEGSGIPSIRIIGYNRRIDWDAMVARIREVIAGKPGVVIE